MKKLILSAVLSCSVFALAEDKPAAPAPDQAKMMETMQKMMTPGPQHAQLATMAGTFKADVKFRMDPNAPEQTSTGTATNEMIFGGKFLKCDFAGEMMGMPFKGLQILGYDNGSKKFQSTWLDEMGTMMLFSQGDADSSGKTITMGCTFHCPLTDGPKKMKSIYTIKSNDEHTFELFDVQPDGKEVRGMVITYTRVK